MGRLARAGDWPENHPVTKAQLGWLIVSADHTDAAGVGDQNLALSHARTAAVRTWMQQMGDIADR
jgi:outer membrane protein OmpA-like peptidoglycan-associated protein